MDAGLDWRKSTRSGNAGCVEVAHLPDGGVALRDSWDRRSSPAFLHPQGVGGVHCLARADCCSLTWLGRDLKC
jgi:hypothetical protein